MRPARKSGVSGGIVTIAWGKGAVGVFAPRLDEAGNSIKDSWSPSSRERLGLNLFPLRRGPNPPHDAAIA
ncbi:MAG: glutaminase [Candidatus Binatia bacterium]